MAIMGVGGAGDREGIGAGLAGGGGREGGLWSQSLAGYLVGCMPRGVYGLDCYESWLKIPLVP